MKKCAAVFGIIFAVSLICFAVSVAATGTDGGFGVSMSFPFSHRSGWNPSYTRYYSMRETSEDVFEEMVQNIEVSTASAHTTIRTADVDKTTVKYKAGERSGVFFGAEVQDGTLRVHENGMFYFNFFSLGEYSAAELEIILPEKEYGEVSVEAASGSISISDLISESFSAETASGQGVYRIFADEIRVQTASGSSELTNCTEKKANSLRMESASGNHKVSGFQTESFRIETASGSVSAQGISGEGKVDIASGIVTLEYAQWDGDLNIDAASGSVDVTLPPDSGANVDLDAFSGGVHASLDGHKADFSHESGGTVGGDNVRKVDVDLMSGSVRLHN